MSLQKKFAVIGVLTFTVLTAAASTNAVADLDDQLDMVEGYGKYVGYVSACSASIALQNRLSSDTISRFVVILGASGKSEISRAVAQGRKNGIRIAKESPETCAERLFSAGKLWEAGGLDIAAATRNASKLPARFSQRLETLSDLTAAIGREVYPALNSCADSVVSADLKKDLRTLQFTHISGPDTSKHPKPDPSDLFDHIYTGDRPGQKVAKDKCADALIFAGAYFKLLEIANDSDNSTPETRYVLRRALGQR